MYFPFRIKSPIQRSLSTSSRGCPWISADWQQPAPRPALRSHASPAEHSPDHLAGLTCCSKHIVSPVLTFPQNRIINPSFSLFSIFPSLGYTSHRVCSPQTVTEIPAHPPHSGPAASAKKMVMYTKRSCSTTLPPLCWARQQHHTAQPQDAHSCLHRHRLFSLGCSKCTPCLQALSAFKFPQQLKELQAAGQSPAKRGAQHHACLLCSQRAPISPS